MPNYRKCVNYKLYDAREKYKTRVFGKYFCSRVRGAPAVLSRVSEHGEIDHAEPTQPALNKVKEIA
ncbi:hypothetical protein J6590_063585 [Homalodisca vitripennis]|nr:hypothetical protein J6590_063585 [Homalodisca vitripennis]